MDDFKWAAFKEGIDTKTLNVRTFAVALVDCTGMTNEQHSYLLKRFHKYTGTMYGILIGNEIWKLNKR